MTAQPFSMEYALAGLWLAHGRLQNLLSRLEEGDLPLPIVFREVDKVEEELGRLRSMGHPGGPGRPGVVVSRQAVFPWMEKLAVNC